MDVNWGQVRSTIEGFGTTVYPFQTCNIEAQLGAGAAMNVFQGTCLIDDCVQPVAFKEHRRWSNRRLRQHDVQQILRELRHEITLMGKLRFHPNIVQILGVTFRSTTPTPILVVELGNDTLDCYLAEMFARKQPVSWFDKTTLCLDVLWGARALHDAKIVHGDLKGDNVLVFINKAGIPRAKLSDFGFSSSLSSSQGHVGGSPHFMAPENTPHHPELHTWCKKPEQDIYGVGMVTFQVATDGSIPYQDSDDILEDKAADTDLIILFEQLPLDTPEEFRDVILGTTKVQPPERMSLDIAEELLRKALRRYPLLDTQNLQHTRSVIERNEPLRAARSLLRTITNLKQIDLSRMKDEDLLTLTLWAVGEDQTELIKLLVNEYGANMNLADETGWNPLFEAVKHGHTDVIKLLVTDLGANINSTDNSGRTPLSKAASDGNIDIVKLFIELKADMNVKDQNGCNSLYCAAGNGHVSVVKLLAGSGADINSISNFGQTPLHIAARNGQVKVIEMLITEFRANKSINDIKGSTILHMAAEGGDLEAVKLLLSRFRMPANAQNVDGWTPLHVAALNGHMEVVKLLLNLGAEINTRSNSGQIPLHLAAEGGHLALVEYFVIERRIDIESTCLQNATPLHYAAMGGHVDLVRTMILNLDANVSAKDNNGDKPLSWAVQYGQIAVVRLLATMLRVDPQVLGKHGNLLHVASMIGQVEIAKALVREFNVDVNAKDRNGYTPLHCAVRYGHVNMVKVLVEELGAKINSKDNSGLTPWDIATEVEKGVELMIVLREFRGKSGEEIGMRNIVGKMTGFFE